MTVSLHILNSDELERADVKFKRESRRICKFEVESFVECTKQHTLSMVYKCTEMRKAMNDCLRKYQNLESWDRHYEEALNDSIKRKAERKARREAENNHNNISAL